MKILSIHANQLTFKATQKALKNVEDVEKVEKSVKECLVIFTAVEKEDEPVVDQISTNFVTEVEDIATQIKAKTVVIYPYAHLSSDLASPAKAVEILNECEKKLKKKFTVIKAPFGWYKEFSIHAKGHPLAELSKKITAQIKKGEQQNKGKPFVLEKKKLSQAEKINFSAAALVAQAVKELYPQAEIGLQGFYQDQAYVDVGHAKVRPDDLPKIEKKVNELIKKSSTFAKGNAAEGKFQKEIAKDLGKEATTYKIEKITLTPVFIDPFVKSAKEIGVCKVLSCANAYWKNSASNEQLIRIYSVAYASEKEIQQYMKQKEEAEKRSHVHLGRELKLFFNNDVSPGSPFFMPKGTIMLNELEKLFREIYAEEGYQEVRTPNMFNNELWKQSGHWDHYRDNMFFIEKENMALKPMNCPAHAIIYKQEMRSYRDLPLRFADFGALHRNELSGTLHGLTRVRRLVQDDAHIFCAEDQIEQEILKLIRLVNRVFALFNTDSAIELSTRPEKALEGAFWEKAETALKNALKKAGNAYKLNLGDGAFYGPKIDFHVKDALGRDWQLSTIQLDFQTPERFDLSYEGKDNKKHCPVMIHRAILGSLERFLGILIEQTEGKFPLWLSPVQVKILTVTERNNAFAQEMLKKLQAEGIRAELDDRQESIGKKVREAQLEKCNYMITIGDNEVAEKTLAVRTRAGQVRYKINPEAFVKELLQERDQRLVK